MASKFGGVAVEEKTSGGSRFGGVPIEAPQDGVVSDFIANSPIGAVQGMAEAIRNPSATVKSALSENERLATEAKLAFGSGDYETSARKGANFLLNAMPGLGSALDAASDDFAAGDYARGTAKTLGLASNMLVGKYGPKVMDKATSPATPKPPKPPSKPVTAGGLMEMAKTGKDILQVLKSPNPLTKLSALGRLFEKFASEVTPIEAPPAPTVVEAPPVASGTPVRPPLRGKQFGTFNDPAAPPLPAGVQPSGPVRPPVAAAAPAKMPALEQITEWLASRDGQTARRFTDPVVSEAPITKQTLGDIMDRLMKNRKVPAEVPAATVPAEVPPAAVETPQPATPAPSAAGKPVTAATLMEEVANPAAQVNNPNYDWRTPEGIKAAFKQYLKDSGFDVVPDRPEFDPTNPKAQGKFGGSAKTQVNMDAKANRFVEYLKANKMEPTPDNVARATETLGEADHPSAHTLEKIYTQMGYDALDVEMLARSLAKAESPAPSATPKPPAKPRSKRTTMGELMEKAKSAEPTIEAEAELVAPKIIDAPRSLSKLYGSNWMERADAAELKSAFNKATRARTKSLEA